MDIARHRSEDLFAALDVRMQRQGNKYVGRCPIHEGDSGDSLIFYPDGYRNRAFWQCLSNHCEQIFTGSLMGFVRGIISSRKYGWESDNRKKSKLIAPMKDVIAFLCDFTDRPWENLRPDMSVAERNTFTTCVENLNLTTPERIKKGICTRKRLLDFLKVPAEYYIKRGYSREILEKYDVGLCTDPASGLYGRVVVPTYNEDGEYVVGCIGRSIHKECPICGMHHGPETSCYMEGYDKKQYVKWLCSYHFNDKNYLYNFWNASNHIIKCYRTVVVVEGCGDVWRLEEAGIPNGVALNGSSLTSPQQVALECSGATHILCLTDNDKAGESAYRNMENNCKRFAKVTRLNPIGVKDVGELDIDDPLFDHVKDICKITTKS